MVDIIINIDLFTFQFEDRNKILTIVKDLFNHCNNMKRLLFQHHHVILTNLMDKYDKKCTIYENLNSGGDSGQQEKRDEFLAVNIGQIIRLFAKSKTLSQGFNNFKFLEKMVDLMKHEQYIIQSDAQKTFDAVFKGPRLHQNKDRRDGFIDWVERNEQIDDKNFVFDRLNEMFRQMRQSNNYSFKRHVMIL